LSVKRDPRSRKRHWHEMLIANDDQPENAAPPEREHMSLKTIANKLICKLRWIPTRLTFQRKGFGDAWRIFTHLTPEERLLLYHLGVKQPQGAIFVEIGSYLGASSCFLAAAVQERCGLLHCVDSWGNEGMTEGKRDTWDEFSNNIMPFSTIIKAHRGFSTDIAASFHESIDLLFVDGNHSYEGCRADLEAWLPRLRDGGMLIMHDYGWAEGVKKVVDEIVKPRQKDSGHVQQNTYWTKIKT